MEQFKENIRSRRDQNIVSSVMMICFFLVGLAFWGIILKESNNQVSQDADSLLIIQNK